VSTRRERLLAFGFALALLLLGAGGLAFQLALPSLLPGPLEWEAVEALLERDARPGDAVLTSPAWAERIRMLAPRGVRVLIRPRFDPSSLEGVRRIWLVSLPRAPGFSWQPEVELLAHASAPDPPLAVGRLEISRYELAHPDLPLASLPERLPNASVSAGGLPCPAQGGVFRCGAGDAQASLESAVLEVDGVPRSCLVARGSGSAAQVLATFGAVPLGRVLRGNVGALPAGGDQAPLPLTVVVRVDGEEAAAVELDAAGWPTFRADTARWAGGKHAVGIALVVPENRSLCLQVVTLP
jgi:hypothetical protein